MHLRSQIQLIRRTRRTVSTGLLACVLACLGSGESPAQFQNRIEGRVQTAPAGPVPDDLRVRLRLMTGSQIARSSVSGNGRFTFDGLRPGRYVVVVEAEGFTPAEQMVEILSGFLHNVYNVVISIQPASRQGVPQQRESTVPVQSLAVPPEAREEMAKAEELARKKEYRSAIEHLEKAVAITPGYFQAFNNMGVYYYQGGQKVKAVEAFRRALAIKPDALDPHSNLGIIYLELSQPDEALPHLERAVQLHSSSSRLQYQLARAYIFLRRFDRAVEPLKQSLELTPPVAHGRYLLAHVFYELNRKGEAVSELRRYIEEGRPKDRAALETRLREWEKEIR